MKTLWILLVVILPFSATAKTHTIKTRSKEVFNVNAKAPLYINQLIRKASKQIIAESAHAMKYKQHGDTSYGYVRTWASYPSKVLGRKPQVIVKVYATTVKTRNKAHGSQTHYTVKFFAEQGIYYISYDSNEAIPELKYNETGWRSKANQLPGNNELNNDISASLRKLMTAKLPYAYER